MNKEKFLQLTWKNYILIEKEFVKNLDFITLDKDNYKCFSSAFLKILLQIGSEVDINAKLLCRCYNVQTKAKNIDDYRREIMREKADFSNTNVNIIQDCDICPFKPWESWNSNVNPDWWRVYNKIKHERNEIGKIMDEEKNYYKFANLEMTLYALGGLYQLLIYIYYDLIDLTDKIKVPIPGSHLFMLSGNKWDKVEFYQDIAFVLDTASGHLFYKTGIY